MFYVAAYSSTVVVTASGGESGGGRGKPWLLLRLPRPGRVLASWAGPSRLLGLAQLYTKYSKN